MATRAQAYHRALRSARRGGLGLFFLYAAFAAPSLSAQQWQRGTGAYETIRAADRIIDGIDYIPFSSVSDGCYARALYMGMELALGGIAAHNVYIVGKLRPAGAKWKWHVAPSLTLDGADIDIIFDPSLSPKPLTRNEWIKLANAKNRPTIEVAPVTHYKMETVQEYAQKNRFGYTPQHVITQVENLPKFKIADIADACRTAYDHIGHENLTSAQKQDKRNRLVQRTNFLVDHLMDVEKIDFGARITNCAQGKYVQGWVTTASL